MTVSKYEKTYVSVFNAINDTEHVNAAVEFLRKQTAPVTCAEVGKGVFGGVYSHSPMSKSYAAQMGQILRHLRKGGFIKMEERKGDPIEIEYEGVIHDTSDNQPEYIRVHDDAGNEYQMLNPKYRPSWCSGRWAKVKKTVTPTIKVYTWVAE